MASKSSTAVCYVVTYRDHKDNSIHELKVRNIEDSSLGLSFIALSGFIFETEGIIVRPEEETKRQHFEKLKLCISRFTRSSPLPRSELRHLNLLLKRINQIFLFCRRILITISIRNEI